MLNLRQLLHQHYLSATPPLFFVALDTRQTWAHRLKKQNQVLLKLGSNTVLSDHHLVDDTVPKFKDLYMDSTLKKTFK